MTGFLPENVVVASGSDEAVNAIHSIGVNAAVYPSLLRRHLVLPDAVRSFLEGQPLSIACNGCSVNSLERTLSGELLRSGFPAECEDVLVELVVDLVGVANAVCMVGGRSFVSVRLSSDWYKGATWHIDKDRVVGTSTYLGPGTEFVSSNDVLDLDKDTDIRVSSEAKIFRVAERMILLSRGDGMPSADTNAGYLLDRGLVHRRPLPQWGSLEVRRVVALVFQEVS